MIYHLIEFTIPRLEGSKTAWVEAKSPSEALDILIIWLPRITANRSSGIATDGDPFPYRCDLIVSRISLAGLMSPIIV